MVLTHTIRIYNDSSVEVSKLPPLWRVLHWKEAGRVAPDNRPEVWPLFPNHFSPFTEPWQLASKAENPLISRQKWTVVYGGGLWIANQQGFGMRIPRANYVMMQDLLYALPKVEMLTCGGNVLTGYEEGNNLVVTVLNWRDNPTLPLQPWQYTVPVMWYVGGAIGRFPQGMQPDGSVVPIHHPLLGDPNRYPKITIPLNCVERWTEDWIPDPFTLYR